MIAVKNLQNLNELLVQEELVQGVSKHYSDMAADKNVQKLMKEINATSVKNHEEMIKYIEEHL